MNTTNRKPATRALLTVLSALLAVGPLSAQTQPTAPTVVNGQATFDRKGNVYTITNTPGTIIQWQGFSIGAGEITRFLQQSDKSAVLNRITGKDPTVILGTLQSNGRVFLVNPNGVLFGAGSRVDVNGLVASSLGMSNQDFLAGRMNFSAGATAGNVANNGSITTPAGGKVYLIAPNVANNGVIQSPGGDVVLAAGRSVQLVDSTSPDLHVVVSAPGDQALNLGQVIAQGGSVGIYGALVNQRGVVNADSAVVGANGKIVFKASGDLLLEAGSVTSADALGTGDGGRVVATSAGRTRMDGSISARGGSEGGNGGFVEVSGTQLSVTGKVDTRAPNGRTGSLLLDPTDIYIANDQASATTAGMAGTDVAVAGDAGFGSVNAVHDSLLTVQTLQDLLATSMVTVTTQNQVGTGQGNITVVSPVAWGSDTSLTLKADAAVNVNAPISVNGLGGVLNVVAGTGINVNDQISTTRDNGVVNLTAGTGISLNGKLSGMNGSRVSMQTAAGDITQTASGTLSVQFVSARADTGAVKLGTETNYIGALAGFAGGAGGFSFRNQGLMQVDTVGTETGIRVTGSGPIELNSGSGILVNANIMAGSGNVTLASSGGTVDMNGGTVTSDGGRITIQGLIVQPTLGDCTLNPTLPMCADILPTLAACTATPTLAGCSVVLPTLAVCTATPTLSGCTAVLPSLASCTATPTLAGCSVVLPTLAQCSATPTLAGCAVVLPTLAQCTATPTLAGCGAVLPTVTACVASPSLPGCSVVLPSLATCTAAPTTAGCSAVLPSLSSCVAAPASLGCSAVLPSLASCTATPTLPGCSNVLADAQAAAQTAALAAANAAAAQAAADAAAQQAAQATAAQAAADAAAKAAADAAARAAAQATSQAAAQAAAAQAAADAAAKAAADAAAKAAAAQAAAIAAGAPTPVPQPSADICTIAPNSALCQILSPPTASEPVKPVQQASNEVIRTIGASAPPAGSTSPAPAKTDEKTATTKDNTASTVLAKKDEPVKKMYCN
jgi:filamentous hemagglutinin family protein